MFGIWFNRKRKKQPSVAKIEKVISDMADRYKYRNVWLYGNYYLGLYEPGDEVQIMLDEAQDPRHIQAFMADCWDALGVYVDVCLMTELTPQAQYVLDNSRLIHRG